MNHDLPLIPVVAGVLLVYVGHFVYTVSHRIHRPDAIRTSRR